MRFVESGVAALAAIEQQAPDVVVTDMRMPGMDGAQLLAEVRQRVPGSVRILLSGYSDPEQLVRAATRADAILAKPCDLAELESTIERCLHVLDSVSDPEIREIVGRVDTLPYLPAVCTALEEELAHDEPSGPRVAAILEDDVYFSARTLQVANAFSHGNVGSVGDAVDLLGVQTLRVMALSVGLFESVAPRVQLDGFSLQQLEQRGILAARIAERLVSEPRRNAAFSAALMHDLGRLVLAAHAPERYMRARDLCLSEGIAFHEAERRLTAVTHGHVGGLLLARWGLPSEVVEAVTHHHSPSRARHDAFEILGAVHVATWLAGWVEHEQLGETLDPDVPLPALDLAYIEAMGFSERIPAWKSLALENARTPVVA